MFRPPAHLVDQWPEVFTDLKIDSLPAAYIDSVVLIFDNGTVWELDIATEVKKSGATVAADNLQQTLKEYGEKVKKINFKIDIDRLKNDVKNETKKLF